MSILYNPESVLVAVSGASVGDNNGTVTQPSDYVGYVATGLAVLFYGSNYVPVKKFDTHDGIFFQFFLCAGIWAVGMAVNAARSFPTFHPTVMIGGAIWTFGNLFAVPIIQTIGMGLAILIWGMFNMLTGWATGRFGLLGIPPQVPSNVAFNYAGVGLCACASIMFFFVRPEVAQTRPQQADTAYPADSEGGRGGSWQRQRSSLSDQDGSISVHEDVLGSLDGAGGGRNGNNSLYPSLNTSHYNHRYSTSIDKRPIIVSDAEESAATGNSTDQRRHSSQEGSQPFWLRLSPVKQRIFGVALAVMIGPMFGVGFVPTYYVQSHATGASQNGLDYVFAHFTGIFVASLVFLLAYTVAMRNRPAVNSRLILPATVSGLMWGVAGASWFLANQVLSESISYPIISTAPAIVAALWSVLVFREIRGLRNLILLCVAISMSAVGSVLNGLSRS